jgi:hypothetical protein
MTEDNTTGGQDANSAGSGSDLPTGVIPRVQGQKAHRRFVQGNPYLKWVMLNVDDAELLLKRGEVGSSFFGPDVSLITTSTIHDEPLGELEWRREENIVRGIGSDYHIPTDYWVYGDMNLEDRIENIESMMDGTRWFARRFSGSNTQILPLATGPTAEERAICYSTFQDLGLSRCVFYGTQYFGGDMGNGFRQLNSAIRDITSEYTLDWMMVIGLQSSRYLAKLPPEVRTAAGQRWIYQSGLRDVSMAEAIERFGEWKRVVDDNLGRRIVSEAENRECDHVFLMSKRRSRIGGAIGDTARTVLRETDGITTIAYERDPERRLARLRGRSVDDYNLTWME